MQLGTITRAAARGIAKVRNGPAVVAQFHHSAGDDIAGMSPPQSVLGKSTAENQAPGDPSIISQSSGAKAEAFRAPAPLFSSPGLISKDGTSIRGFKSTSSCNHKDGKRYACCDRTGPHQHFSGDSSKSPPSVLEEEDSSYDITSHPMWNIEPIDHLLENNKKWVESKTAQDPDFFKRLASVHKPEYLFIGCSDARLSVQHMLGLEAGELFVHRNVANQVMNTDMNLLTVLTYAVDYLKVKHIIVCGHYDCGGVRAAMKNHDHGLIENWIMGVKDVARLHRKELKQLSDDEAIHRRMVELNVQEQCTKLYANPVVQKSQAGEGRPYVHAMVFDVGQGLVKELDVDFKDIIKKYRNVYSMYDFKSQ